MAQLAKKKKQVPTPTDVKNLVERMRRRGVKAWHEILATNGRDKINEKEFEDACSLFWDEASKAIRYASRKWGTVRPAMTAIWSVLMDYREAEELRGGIRHVNTFGGEIISMLLDIGRFLEQDGFRWREGE